MADNVKSLLISGNACSGKTTALARRACELGAGGQDVLVVAACPGGLREMRKHLEQLPGGAKVRAVCATRLAAELLALPEVCARMGYKARLTLPSEDAMLFEDLKTSGIKRERLRQMTGFFERTYSDMGEQADDFPFEWEETGMLAYQQDYLKTYGVTTLGRATCAIARCLESDEALAERVGHAHVLVDDYQLLGRAMQRICCLLARESVTAAWGNEPVSPVNFRFPNPDGADEFAQRYPDTQVEKLAESRASAKVCAALDAMRADEGMELEPLTCADAGKTGAGERTTFATPAAEFAGIARILQDAHDQGIAWNQMALTGISELWTANAAASLQRAGIPLAFLPGADALPVGFRSEKRNDAARLASMLTLAARPDDGMAWRTWCGFGSYTANSACFMRIRRAALEGGRSVRSVIEEMRKAGYPDIAKLADSANVLQALDEAEFALKRLEGLRGQELLEKAAELSQVNDGKPAASVARLIRCARVASDLEGGENAETLLELLEQGAFQTVPSAGDAVLACTPEALAGERFRLVVFCGAVNGIVPVAKFFDPAQLDDDKRERMRRKDDARLYAAFSRATEALHVTSFRDIGLEQAERLGLEADRIRAERGMRIAAVSPSVLTAAIPHRIEPGETL